MSSSINLSSLVAPPSSKKGEGVGLTQSFEATLNKYAENMGLTKTQINKLLNFNIMKIVELKVFDFNELNESSKEVALNLYKKTSDYSFNIDIVINDINNSFNKFKDIDKSV